MSNIVLVLSTFPTMAAAMEAGRTLVGEKLVACVNVLPEMKSIYRWEGQVCEESEFQLVAKTTDAAFEAVRKKIAAIHTYKCPEIVAIPIARGADSYLAWVGQQVLAFDESAATV